MRIAVYSDVHGNLSALEAVLNHIDQQAGVDQLIFAGDAAMFGPRPAECVARIRAHADIAVVGNTDEWIFAPPPVQEDAPNRERLEYIARYARWTDSMLDDAGRDWLRALPFAHRISPTPDPTQDLLVVHANPWDTMQVISPPIEVQQAMRGEVEQSDAALGELLQGVTAAVIAFGHLHVPNVRRHNDMILANISSVSLPVDDDKRAKYGLLEWDGSGWMVTHRRVPYNVQAEIDAFSRFQPPGWEESVADLRKH